MSQSMREKAISWAFCLVPFLWFWSFGIFDLDEGYYAAISDHMVRTGDWIMPMLNGAPWLEKPILVYWITNPFVLAFGDVLGPRLGSVLCSIGTLAIVGWFTNRLSGKARGDVSRWILSGTVLFTLLGNMLLSDPGLLLASTAGMLLFLGSILWQPWLRWVSAVAIGFSVLAKGPYPLVVLAIVVAWTFIVEPDLRPSLLKGWTRFFAIVVAVCSLWYVPVYLREPDNFVSEFLIRQNLGRLMGKDLAHSVPIWAQPIYYIVILGVLAAPWSFYVLKLRDSAQNLNLDASQHIAKRFLTHWALALLGLFTIGATKLPHYILPVTIPIAILIAMSCTEENLSKISNSARAMCVACALLIAMGGSYYYRVSGQAQAHSIAKLAYEKHFKLATFQLEKRESSAKVQIKLQETLLPSLAFYAHQDVPDFEVLSANQVPKEDFVLFTRPGRIQQREYEMIQQQGRVLEPWKDAPTLKGFEAYLVRAAH